MLSIFQTEYTIISCRYGDKAPRTGAGRLIAIIWMITGLILFPVLTAEVTSILTDNSYSLVSKKVSWSSNILRIVFILFLYVVWHIRPTRPSDFLKAYCEMQQPNSKSRQKRLDLGVKCIWSFQPCTSLILWVANEFAAISNNAGQLTLLSNSIHIKIEDCTS